MYEVLTTGKVAKEFKRLGIKPKRTYGGLRTPYSVYQMTETEYEILDQDSRNSNDGNWKDASWRWAQGSNVREVPTEVITVNGETLRAWIKEGGEKVDKPYVFETILEYFSKVMGCSTARNVCALSIHLAKYNDMTLGQFFTKYQGYKEWK